MRNKKVRPIKDYTKGGIAESGAKHNPIDIYKELNLDDLSSIMEDAINAAKVLQMCQSRIDILGYDIDLIKLLSKKK